ncbi:F-box/kelch-repeat protein At5g60570-like isoform X3 [Curcuma longa]|uniref:F-box/kelch-repeat protein At5g60570-like isoform X3 n=1 Tax=Curcuma longa TaxID=136217 RepID=UPI003D9EE843
MQGTLREKKIQHCKLGTMVATPSYLLQILGSFSQECGSFHKYLLACLLANNVSLLEEDKDAFDKDVNVDSLSVRGLKAKKLMVSNQTGDSYTDPRSDDNFFPGLYDDVALACLAFICRSDYPSLACLNKRFNSLIRSGCLYKLRRQHCVIEHWVYLACSLMPWEAFDPFRRRWMRLPRMPCDDCFSCADKESLAVGTQLLVFGREVSGFVIWMYSLVRRDWSRCPPMNLSRCLFGSGSSGEIAIVAGGSDSLGRTSKCVEMYNSETGTWETLPDMNIPRRLCSGFFMDDQSTNEVKKYDKANNTWNVVKRLPVRADYSNGWGLAFKACGDKLLVIGGHRGPQGEVIILHYWRPEDGNAGGAEWDVLSIRERAGAFVYNCAIMGC